MMSAVAPGGIGTIQRIGLVGYDCDSAAQQMAGSSKNTAAAQTRVPRIDDIPTPHTFRGDAS
jgi:hypothetical protein